MKDAPDRAVGEAERLDAEALDRAGVTAAEKKAKGVSGVDDGQRKRRGATRKGRTRKGPGSR